MKLSKTDFSGTAKVFRFTLSQYVKSKANITSFIALVLICLLTVPLTSFLSEGEEAFAVDIPANLYIVNQTDLPIRCDKEDLSAADLAGTDLKATEDIVLGAQDAILYFAEKDGMITSKITFAQNTNLGENALSTLTFLCQKLITDAKCEMMGISEESLSIMENMPALSVKDAENYLSGTNEEGLGAQFILQYVYSILVMMLTLIASSYIIRSVIEEKSSKLVELLMVSVKPLALLAGKILCMMLTVFVTIVSMITAILVSNFLSVKYLGTAGFGQMLSSLGIDFGKLNLGVETVLLTLFGIFTAYLTYAVLAGIAGSCCSAMEQADSANTLVVLTVMFGYLVSSVVANIPSTAVAYFTALCPVISAFCAPVQYAVGNIPLWVFFVSLLIQFAIAFLLIRFCAKVYHSLLIYRGNRVKWKQLFQIAKEGKIK